MDGRGLVVDRISDLPDPLITQILSLLTTKEAVHTCMLSKRWTNLWTSVDTLDFDLCKSEFDWEENFLWFVHGVLNRRGFSRLDKFKLSWRPRSRRNHGVVEECINHAVACMPRVIDIYTPTYFAFNFPDSVFNCGSVKEMSLFSLLGVQNFLQRQPKSVNLPSLKKLELGNMVIRDSLIKMLLLGCPVLEELVLTHCWLMINEINSSVLMKLTIKECHFSDRAKSITLKNSRSLRSLELGDLAMTYGWNLLSCFLQHSPNLKKLVLNFHHSEVTAQEVLLRKFSFQHDFLEIVEIKVKEGSEKTIKEVVTTLGALVKTIGKIVILKFVVHPSNRLTSLGTVLV